MKKLILFITLASIAISSELNYNSIVKVHSSLSIPNYKYPWQTSKRSQISGSGVIIQDNYIITNAHVVSNAKFIQLSHNQSSKKYTANIKYISHQSDLALLEVEDKSFFNNTKALKFTEDIKTGDSITVLGYPIGGNSLSTTKGTISRIEPHKYVWSYEKMLCIQIDAAINSGNSGGAVIDDNNNLIGIVMQSYSKLRTDNIGYIVPSIIVNTLLEDIKDGKVNGFDNSFTNVQNLDNEALRDYYNIKDDEGVLVSQIEDNESILKHGDILLEVDGHKIRFNEKYGCLKT